MYFYEFYLNFVYLYSFLQNKWDDEYKKSPSQSSINSYLLSVSK